jgi:prepilin-type N-terminal cleavage/methylation domain-containing protein
MERKLEPNVVLCREGRTGFTLVELVFALSILAIVLLTFLSGFAVIRDRGTSSAARVDLRAQASATLEAIARELADAAPGYVDTTQRSPLLGSPGGTPSDVFEDPLFDPSHPKRQALNCSSSGGLLQACPALSSLGTTTGTATAPGKWLGPTTQPGVASFQGIALNRQMAPQGVCPFCGSVATPSLAYTDVLLFLSPRDPDKGGFVPQLSADSTRLIYSTVVVYAPWIDERGAGSLRRYTLPFSSVKASASLDPGNVTLAQLLDPDGDGVLFQVASPQTYDLGTVNNNLFVLDQSSSVPLNPGRPSIVWQKGSNAGEHVTIVFDRETGAASWDISRQFGASSFVSASPAGGVPRVVRTLASGAGYGCCDFACSTVYSNAPDPVLDARRVRLAIAVGRSFAAGTRNKDALVAIASLDVSLRNGP